MADTGTVQMRQQLNVYCTNTEEKSNFKFKTTADDVCEANLNDRTRLRSFHWVLLLSTFTTNTSSKVHWAKVIEFNLMFDKYPLSLHLNTCLKDSSSLWVSCPHCWFPASCSNRWIFLLFLSLWLFSYQNKKRQIIYWKHSQRKIPTDFLYLKQLKLQMSFGFCQNRTLLSLL